MAKCQGNIEIGKFWRYFGGYSILAYKSILSPMPRIAELTCPAYACGAHGELSKDSTADSAALIILELDLPIVTNALFLDTFSGLPNPSQQATVRRA